MVDLKPHNIHTYNEVKTVLKTDNRVAIIQATGTGKSYIIMQLLEDYENTNKLVVVPSIDLIRQYKNNEYWVNKRVRCVTYQKLLQMHKEGVLTSKTFKGLGLIIVDELHRTGALAWGVAFNKLLELYPDAKVVGASATPIRYLDYNRDMVEEIFHGNSVGNITLAQAISRGIVPAPVYISSLYTIKNEIDNRVSKVKKNYRRGDKSKDREKLLDSLRDIRLEWEDVSGVPVLLKRHTQHLVERDGGIKIIVFCNNLQALKGMKPKVISWVTEAYPMLRLNLYEYHYKNTRYETQFEDFKKAKTQECVSVLLVVDKLNEGVHIPDVSTLIMLRKTISPNIYLQQLGRVIASGGDSAVIFDLVNNCNSVGISTKFWEEVNHYGSTGSYPADTSAKGVTVEVYDYVENALTLLHQIDSRILNQYEMLLQEVKKAVASGESINNLSDSNLSYFVRHILSVNRLRGASEDIAKELRDMGAIEYKIMQWTVEEENILRKYYVREGEDVLKRLPNRTRNGLYKRLKKLGISANLFWTAKEDLIIKKNYPSMGSKMAYMLPERTTEAVVGRAKALGVRRDSMAWSDKEIDIIRTYYPTMGMKVKTLLKNRTEASIAGRASLLGLKRVNLRSPRWTQEELLLLKRFYPYSDSEMLRDLGKLLHNRTPQAMRTKANDLGIRKINVGDSRVREELGSLLENCRQGT